MAEEAFALSPINARPSVPGEADYDAIREAFMETTRGRWFLAEYAKRNRTADTSLVLEAVTRLEANLAAQKQPSALSLVAALGAIRSVVRQAKASAIEAMPRVDSDETQNGARNGARIIREIAWTLRECGADTRICDLLDTHIKAIETAQQALGGNGRDEVLASYDLLMQRIEQMADGSATASADATPAPPADQPFTSAAESREASVTPLFKSQASEALAETVTIAPPVAQMASEPAAPPPAVHAAIDEDAVAVVTEAVAELAATMADTELEAEQHDLAVLDIIAAEMGASDHDEPDLIVPVTPQPEVVQRPAAAPTMTTDLMTLAQIAEAALAPEQVATEATPAAPQAPSLGAALIANGVIAHPTASGSDPLAPLRKMTQAEKIAFFS